MLLLLKVLQIAMNVCYLRSVFLISNTSEIGLGHSNTVFVKKRKKNKTKQEKASFGCGRMLPWRCSQHINANLPSVTFLTMTIKYRLNSALSVMFHQYSLKNDLKFQNQAVDQNSLFFFFLLRTSLGPD